MSGIDLPDEDDFDYDTYIESEFGAEPSGNWRGLLRWAVLIVLVIAFLGGMLLVRL